MGGLVVPPLDGERCGVYADLDRCRPVGVHLTVFVVVALKLQLEVRSGQTSKQKNELVYNELVWYECDVQTSFMRDGIMNVIALWGDKICGKNIC